MDSLIGAAARALASGDVLGGLKFVALRDDPSALALRGIAMAQLGEHALARDLLRRAARGFGAHEASARARCVVAEAEVALAMRDLGGPTRPLMAAGAILQARGDHVNAMRARLIGVRRLLLLGRLDEAARDLGALGLDTQDTPPSLAWTVLIALAELCATELALRSLRIDAARVALARARAAALRADVPALVAEVDELASVLSRPAARCRVDGVDRDLLLPEVAEIRASGALVVDACRRAVRLGEAEMSLARRPILFVLLAALADAWPAEVGREVLIERAFRIRRPDETHRARLRVEIGRLRKWVAGGATIQATARGFVMQARDARAILLLRPPADGAQGTLAALLADGAPWSTSSLALAVGASQRTVQRALVELEAEGRVRAVGRAGARRWLAPARIGHTTILLLPGSLAPG